MSFFTSPDVTLANKVMEIIYIIIGLLCIYCGVKNLKDKENPEPVGTFIFWAVLGVVLALGRWLPSLVSGILVVVMCIPAILKKVKKGAVVRNCVLMQDTVVEANAELDCVVTDKNVKITAGKKLSGTESFPVYVQKKHTV